MKYFGKGEIAKDEHFLGTTQWSGHTQYFEMVVLPSRLGTLGCGDIITSDALVSAKAKKQCMDMYFTQEKMVYA